MVKGQAKSLVIILKYSQHFLYNESLLYREETLPEPYWLGEKDNYPTFYPSHLPRGEREKKMWRSQPRDKNMWEDWDLIIVL